MIYSFKDSIPVVHKSAFIHPLAAVTGDVIIGKNVYVGPGAAVRGDWGRIILEDGCNVQENCTIHLFPGSTITLKEGAHIGHGAIIHGAQIGRHVLIGMNAVIMDNAVIEDECIVGALSFVKSNQRFEKRSMIVGNPAKKIKTVSDKMMAWKIQGTEFYQQLPKACHDTLKPCEPVQKIKPNKVKDKIVYKTWNEIKDEYEDS